MRWRNWPIFEAFRFRIVQSTLGFGFGFGFWTLCYCGGRVLPGVELLFQVGVPNVFYFIVCPTRQSRCNCWPSEDSNSSKNHIRIQKEMSLNSSSLFCSVTWMIMCTMQSACWMCETSILNAWETCSFCFRPKYSMRKLCKIAKESSQSPHVSLLSHRNVGNSKTLVTFLLSH